MTEKTTSHIDTTIQIRYINIMNIGKPKPTREEKILAWKKAQGISLAS